MPGLINNNANAFLSGLVGGFATQYDAHLNNPTGDAYANQQAAGAAANSVPATQAEADNKGYGKTFMGGANSPTGTRYAMPNNSFMAQMFENIAHSSLNFVQTGDMGQAVQAGANAVQDLNNRHYRGSQAEKLEAQGYNPIDIQRWLITGDSKDLVANLGNRTVNVNGHNIMMTGAQAEQHEQNQAQREQFGKTFEENKRHSLVSENQGQQQIAISQQNANTSAASAANTARYQNAELGLRERQLNQQLQIEGMKQDVKNAEKVQAAQQSNAGIQNQIDTQNTLMNDVNAGINAGVHKGLAGGLSHGTTLNTPMGESKEEAGYRSKVQQLQSQANAIALAAYQATNKGPMTENDYKAAITAVPQVEWGTNEKHTQSVQQLEDYIRQHQAVLQSQLKPVPGGSTASYPAASSLKVGDVVGGHTYQGGDPASQASWR